MRVVVSLYLLLCLPLVASAASTTPTYKLDTRGKQVVELSNLTDGTECHPDRLVGKVVKRHYDEDRATKINGVTIQYANGSREFLNIDEYSILDEGMSMTLLDLIYEGLDTLLKVGNKVRIGFYRCGAAGRTLFVHSIRPADDGGVSSGPSWHRAGRRHYEAGPQYRHARLLDPIGHSLVHVR
jgi:hypothetical protein